jgi:hypothetical protein
MAAEKLGEEIKKTLHVCEEVGIPGAVRRRGWRCLDTRWWLPLCLLTMWILCRRCLTRRGAEGCLYIFAEVEEGRVGRGYDSELGVFATATMYMCASPGGS